MKTIGLLGGMSWESTIEYYRIVNQATRDRLGPLASAKIIMVSVNFAEIESLQHAGRWDDAGQALAEAAARIEGAGADVLVICTNTMHKVAPAIERRIAIPILHIADPTAARIKAEKISRIGLLATGFTMEQDFYRGRLEERHGLEVLVPDQEGRTTVHRIIYEELCAGVIKAESKAAYQQVIADLIERGIEGIILGCTEIGLLIKPTDVAVPLFDTTEIHARAAVDFALET